MYAYTKPLATQLHTYNHQVLICQSKKKKKFVKVTICSKYILSAKQN